MSTIVPFIVPWQYGVAWQYNPIIVLSTSDSAAGDMNLYERLTAELAAAIRGGNCRGSALPPVREFARLRGIGPSTAARVYASLRQQGWPLAKGRGTFVRERPMDGSAVGGRQGTRHWAAAPWRWRRRTCAPRSRRSPPSLTWRS